MTCRVYNCRLRPMNAIQQAADMVGGVGALARALNVSYQAVRFWINGERLIEPLRCVQVEHLTRGAVTRMDLRPDDWFELWPELAAMHPKRAALGRSLGSTRGAANVR